MANHCWLDDREKKGGRAKASSFPDLYRKGCRICTVKEYMAARHKGYEMDWTPPEWIQDIFPSRWDSEK